MKFQANIEVESEEGMRRLGQQLSALIAPQDVVYLSGDLGVGKTTLARALIQAYGFHGRVKSPTYGLVETYPTDRGPLAHLDLYRLESAEEIHDLGLESYLDQNMRILIEWPERALSYLPAPDWQITITDTDCLDTNQSKDASYRLVFIEAKGHPIDVDPVFA